MNPTGYFWLQPKTRTILRPRERMWPQTPCCCIRIHHWPRKAVPRGRWCCRVYSWKGQLRSWGRVSVLRRCSKSLTQSELARSERPSIRSKECNHMDHRSRGVCPVTATCITRYSLLECPWHRDAALDRVYSNRSHHIQTGSLLRAGTISR